MPSCTGKTPSPGLSNIGIFQQGPRTPCNVAVALPARASTTDSMRLPRASCMPLEDATLRPMAHALSFIKASIHHFLQAHLRSQRSFSCHNRWSNALAARRPTFVKASSTISLSITAVCSSGRHGIGGILHFHVGIDKDSDCTIIGLYSFKSHGITCNFLLCLEFQQNWVCKEKASGVLVDHSSKITCSRSSLVRLQLICTIRNWRLRRKISCHRWRRHCPRWQR